MHLGRQVFEQEGERGVHCLIFYDVVVVEDYREVFGYGGGFVHEIRQEGPGWRLGRVEQRTCLFARGRRGVPERGHQVREEASRVVVVLVERDPPDREPAPEDPIAEEGALAEAGRGANEREPAPGRLFEVPDQAQARHQIGSDGRDVELCGHERIRGLRVGGASPC